MGIGNTQEAFKTNQSVLLSSELARCILLLAKSNGERRCFLDGASIDLSSKLSRTYQGNVNHDKKYLSFSSYSVRGNREHPVKFQNKSVSFSFKWVSRYILSFNKLKRKGRHSFWRVQKSRRSCDFHQERLVVIRNKKSIFFCEIPNNSTLPLLFITSHL